MVEEIARFVPGVFRRKALESRRCATIAQAPIGGHPAMRLEHSSVGSNERHVEGTAHTERVDVVAGDKQKNAVKRFATEQAP